MLIPLIPLAFLAGASPSDSLAAVSMADRVAAWVRATDRQRVEVWTNREEDPYQRGDQARVYFRTAGDGYVAVLRVDTDGRVRVLFPREPWEDNFARGGRTFEVLDRNDEAFVVDDAPGVGYVFAVSSPDPFTFDDYVRGDHWDYRTIADGRVRGDPYVTLTDFAAQIVGPGEYDYDIVPYYVDRHYDYPRFVCYDCHTYVSYSYWDPYRHYCSRFRIVIYDDYYYYPYRYYTNVVIVRPYRPAPRYVFKDYDGRGTYVTRERQRPSDGRIYERDRTSADVGGRGSVPAPVEPRRRAPAASAERDRGTARDDEARSGGSVDARRRPSSGGRASDDARPSGPDREGSSSEPRRRPVSESRGIVPRDDAEARRPSDSRPDYSQDRRSDAARGDTGNEAWGRRPADDRDRTGSSGASGGSRPSSEPRRPTGSSSGGASRPTVEPRRQPSSGGSSGRVESSGGRSSSGSQPQLRRRRPE